MSDSHFFVRLLAVVACALLAAVARAQGAPSLSLPVACGLGRECVLQNYPDADPGPAARDYRCGRLSYDGHKGTDVRVIDAEALRRGVPVLAAASGRVRAVRDGMPDVSVRVHGRKALAGRDAGNSVVIEHGPGWETQYAHLRAGSVAVRTGEEVERGRLLGHVGLSGNTEFHHLHFEVRYHGRAVDPFVGLAGGAECQAGASTRSIEARTANVSFPFRVKSPYRAGQASARRKKGPIRCHAPLPQAPITPPPQIRTCIPLFRSRPG